MGLKRIHSILISVFIASSIILPGCSMDSDKKTGNTIITPNAEVVVNDEPIQQKPPFKLTPEFSEYNIPAEVFNDSLEEEASHIIDEASC